MYRGVLWLRETNLRSLVTRGATYDSATSKKQTRSHETALVSSQRLLLTPSSSWSRRAADGEHDVDRAAAAAEAAAARRCFTDGR